MRPARRAAVGALERALPGIHGTAKHFPTGILHAVLHGRVDFRVLGCHAEDARDPHPEHGTRTARQNGRGNAHDGTRAHRCGKRRGKSAELAHVAFSVFVLGNRKPNGRGKLALNEPRTERQEKMRPEEQADHDRPPYECINLVEYRDNIHNRSKVYVFTAIRAPHHDKAHIPCRMRRQALPIQCLHMATL